MNFLYSNLNTLYLKNSYSGFFAQEYQTFGGVRQECSLLKYKNMEKNIDIKLQWSVYFSLQFDSCKENEKTFMKLKMNFKTFKLIQIKV